MCCLRTVCAWHTGLSGTHAPDCPVPQGTAAQRLVPGGTRREDHRTVRWHTGLSGVESLWRQRSPALTGYLTGQRLGAPDRLQCVVRCTAEKCSFSPTATIVLGAINTPPTDHSQGEIPSNIPRHIVHISKSSNTQVLNRITRCFAKCLG
jgi:hypothetical protein